MKWNIIWQVDPDDLASCIERDWFYELTSLVPKGSIQVDYAAKPLLKAVLPHAIVCASTLVQTRESDLIRYLQRLPRPRILYHMSDEIVAIGREVYQHCDLVIRNGSANFELFNSPDFVQVPAGFESGLQNRSRALHYPSSHRRYSFAFLGMIKHERATEMLPSFERISGPHFIRQSISYADSTRYFDQSTIDVFRDTVFIPSPKGNFNPETNRPYAALEWGCIPLIRNYRDSTYTENYYDKLLGRHPIPTFDNWSEAAEFADGLLADSPALDALQAQIFTWWQNHKARLQSKVAHKIAALI